MGILLLSFFMMLSYPSITENAEAYKDRILAGGDLPQLLIQSNYSLYSKMQKEELIDKYDTEVLGNTSEDRSLSTIWSENLMKGYLSIEYVAIDNETQNIRSNIPYIESKLEQVPPTPAQLDDQYEFFIAFQYNENGEINILLDSTGAESGLKFNILNLEQGVKDSLSQKGLHQVKNMTYFYGISKINGNGDSLVWEIDSALRTEYMDMAVQIMYALTLCLIIVALLIPYRVIKEVTVFQWIYRVPLELLIFLGGFIISVQFSYAGEMIRSYKADHIVYFYGIFIGNIAFSPIIVKLINLISWLIYFGTIVVFVWGIKSMHQEGVKNYLVQHTLVGRGYIVLIRKLMDRVEQLSHTHFEDLEEKSLKRFMLISLFVLSGLCCLWLFGIIGILIYVLGVYWVIEKALQQIKYYYQKLLNTTTDLAKGDLDTKILEEELGIFEPIKQRVEQIQIGFKQSVEEEIRSQKLKTELITNVSHDLKTPLTSIVSYVSLLKQEDLSKEVREQYIDILERKSIRLQTLIEDLFEMSKANSGNIILTPERVDLIALIKQTLFELDDNIQAARVQFRTRFEEDKVYLVLDSTRTFRVFDNLINNITKYAMPNSRAYIEVTSEGDEVVIVLKNTAKEELDFDQDEITERFVRGDRSRHTEGSGLGLAIAKSFVELQNGSLKIELDGDLFKVIIRFKKDIGGTC